MQIDEVNEKEQELCPCDALILMVQYALEVASQPKIDRRGMKELLTLMGAAAEACVETHH
jgi:hypothetical protein